MLHFISFYIFFIAYSVDPWLLKFDQNSFRLKISRNKKYYEYGDGDNDQNYKIRLYWSILKKGSTKFPINSMYFISILIYLSNSILIIFHWIPFDIDTWILVWNLNTKLDFRQPITNVYMIKNNYCFCSFRLMVNVLFWYTTGHRYILLVYSA